MSLVAAERNRARLSELKRCKHSLWHLANKLGYGWNPKAGKYGKGLTERVHKRVCDWLDARRDRPFVFIEMARWHHKTTIAISLMNQEILWNPNIAMLYWHSVDGEAARTVDEVRNLILKNAGLRALDPILTLPDGTYQKAFPGSMSKKFGTSSEFTLNRSVYSRFDTLLGRGIQSVIVGAHGNIGFLDDIIERSTIEDNQLPKVAAIFQNTIIPVIDDMRLRAMATPWSDWGLQADWLEDPDWCTLVLPGAVKREAWEAIDWTQDKIHLAPDYKFEYPTYGPEEMIPTQRRRLQQLQRQMKADFGPQIMCDPSPAEDKPWDKETCERSISRDALGGGGVVFVLSDPAPAKIGADDMRGEKVRGDGSKDAWAIAVVKIRVRGQAQERILLDGASSKEWSADQGWDETARLARKWGTSYVAQEATGSAVAFYEEDLKRVGRRHGVHMHLIPLQWTYKGKHRYMQNFASAAKLGEILFCKETVPKYFLDEALQQLRGWRRIAGGTGNGLRHDDEANAWMFCMDPGLQDFAPQPHRLKPEIPWSPYMEPNQEPKASGSRYVRW